MNDDPGQPQPSSPTTTAARDWKWPLLLATGLDVLAVAALAVGADASSGTIVASASLHLLAVCAAGFPTAAGRSQRTLMAALTLALPPMTIVDISWAMVPLKMSPSPVV